MLAAAKTTGSLGTSIDLFIRLLALQYQYVQTNPFQFVRDTRQIKRETLNKCTALAPYVYFFFSNESSSSQH